MARGKNEMVSFLERHPHFRGVLIEVFHMERWRVYNYESKQKNVSKMKYKTGSNIVTHS